MSAINTSRDTIETLVHKFHDNVDRFRDPNYNETQVRTEFINPMFAALGWQVANSLHVIHEDRVLVQDGDRKRVKHPDYGFRTGRDIRFYVEAKKPSVDLQRNPDPAYQVRRYGWSRGLPLSVLTDFEEFSVYNCLQRPAPDDAVQVARLRYLTYDEYLDAWDDIYGLFSYEAVLDGALERFIEAEKPRGTITVDTAFLQELERWRDLLARDIAERNPRLTHRQLNVAVQRTIDRLVFLRITEDRRIEGYGQLNTLAHEQAGVYGRLKALYARANDKYNSGLFHFTDDDDLEIGDPVSLKIEVGDAALRDIIGGLYYPHSPYEFSVLPADILGQVYERFLGSVIVLEGGSAHIEEKPEVRKAGGVYYTPTYIVDYIVANTVGKLLEGKNPAQVSELRILDPACGSGSFLIGAYQFLIDWHVDYYTARLDENPNSSFKSRVREADDPALRYALTTDEKKRILLNNLYGVDLDQQAVEVTKLSLLLKMLEGETATTTATQFTLMGTDEQLLPDLADNVKWGNSLIGSDFYAGQQMTMFDLPDEEIYRVKAFDWEVEFAAIMRAGGFDAVIGNPPYGATIPDDQTKYLSNKHTVCATFPDSYVFFIVKALELVKDQSPVGYIVPNTFCDLESCDMFRYWLMTNHDLSKIWQSGWAFKDAVVDTLVFICIRGNTSQDNILEVQIDDRSYIRRVDTFLKNELHKIDYRNSEDDRSLLHKVMQITTPLSEIATVNAGVKMYERGKGNPPQTKELIKERPFSVKDEKPEGWRVLYRGKDVTRYSFASPREFVNYGEWLAAPRTPELFISPKILMRRTDDRLLSSIDLDDAICVNSCHVIKFSNSESRYSYYYLLGILNSKLLQHIFELQNPQMVDKVFAEVKVIYVLRLPIRTIDFDDPAEVAQHDRMVALVESMLELHKQLSAASGAAKKLIENQIARTDREIDALVYALYGLTEEEIAIVEGG